jgi:hypothetical protein
MNQAKNAHEVKFSSAISQERSLFCSDSRQLVNPPAGHGRPCSPPDPWRGRLFPTRGRLFACGLRTVRPGTAGVG